MLNGSAPIRMVERVEAAVIARGQLLLSRKTEPHSRGKIIEMRIS